MNIKTLSTLLSAIVLLSGSSALAMGQRAEVYETAKEAAIWSHTGSFYLRTDLQSLADLDGQSFVWAGFQEAGNGLFQGEIVTNQFAPDERRFPARAKLLGDANASSYFLIEVLDGNSVIKEFIVKGPAYTSGHGLLTR